jgi:hypothetical protein
VKDQGSAAPLKPLAKGIAFGILLFACCHEGLLVCGRFALLGRPPPHRRHHRDDISSQYEIASVFEARSDVPQRSVRGADRAFLPAGEV